MGTVITQPSSSLIYSLDVRLLIGGVIFIALGLLFINLFWKSKFLRLTYGYVMIFCAALITVAIATGSLLALQDGVLLSQSTLQGTTLFLIAISLVALITAIRPLTISSQAALYASRRGLGDESGEAVKVPLYFASSFILIVVGLCLTMAVVVPEIDIVNLQNIMVILCILCAFVSFIFLRAYFSNTFQLPRSFAKFVYKNTVKEPVPKSAIKLGATEAITSFGYVLLPVAIIAIFSYLLSIEPQLWISVYCAVYAIIFITVAMFLAHNHISAVTVLAWVNQSKRLMWLSAGLILLLISWIGLMLVGGELLI